MPRQCSRPVTLLTALCASIAACAALVLPGSTASATAQDLSVGSLTAEHVTNPFGLDVARPRLSWVVSSGDRGTAQDGYEVRVARTAADLGAGRRLTWDSGAVRSAQSFDVTYSGAALQPRTRYFWDVRVWDNHGNATNWSEPTWFETAFLSPSQFAGAWIGRDNDLQGSSAPEALLRKSFVLHQDVSAARVYLSALGYGYLYVNGRPASDHLLDTAFTSYDKTISYTTYDIGSLLRPGTNVVAVSLGHGMYANPSNDYAPVGVDAWGVAAPKLKLELDVQYAPGGTTRVLSDTSWLTSAGPTTADSPAVESYDARLEQPGWASTGFDSRTWTPAISATAPSGVLRAQLIPPVREVSTLTPVRVSQPAATSKLYDFSLTTSGASRVTMQGARGTKVYIRYAEKDPSTGADSTAQVDSYVLKGGGPETYEPRYGWKGYRYVEVTTVDPSSTAPALSAPPALPEILSVQGTVFHTAFADAGTFESSSGLFNRMEKAQRDTILNNTYSFGSDTPAYEKAAWTADNGLFAHDAMLSFDAEPYYEKMLQDFDDVQLPNGNIGWLAPTNLVYGAGEDPLWGGSFLLIAHSAFQHYNDLALVRRDYDRMAAYMDHMSGLIASTGYIYMGETFGDWEVPGNGNSASSQLLGSLYLYREASDLATMAAAIGRHDGAAQYAELASNIARAVEAKFYDPTAHLYRDPPGTVSLSAGGPIGVYPVTVVDGEVGSTGRYVTLTEAGYSQTANAVALGVGLPPVAERPLIAKGLAHDAVSLGDHLSTGSAGAKYLLGALTEQGQGEEAYKIATNPTYPGWGAWFGRCGATTMWEQWDDATCKRARSHDHAFMGTIDDWFYDDLVGIQPTSPAYRTLRVKPYLVGDLTYVRGSLSTPYGRVSSSWTRSSEATTLDVTVPVGTRAAVFVPATSAAAVTEGGQALEDAPGVRVVGMQGSYLEVSVGSGSYAFRSTAETAQVPSSSHRVEHTSSAAAGSTPSLTAPARWPATAVSGRRNAAWIRSAAADVPLLGLGLLLVLRLVLPGARARRSANRHSG